MSKKFKYNSRIFEHLGKDLITSPEVAVIELIKNSFDAGSTKSYIHIFNNKKSFSSEQLLSSFNSDIFSYIPPNILENPFIIFEDLGKGMDEKTIDDGFLEVGTNIKNLEKNNLPENTILLGAKGIGRLSTQRLGKLLVVETASDKETFISIFTINWDDIMSGSSILEKEVPYFQMQKKCSSFTRLWIFNANLQDYFSNYQQLTFFMDNKPELNPELKSSVSFLISPFVPKEKEIKFFYNNTEIESNFNTDILKVAENQHYFRIEKNVEIQLQYGLDITPWFIQRIYSTETKDKDILKSQKICKSLFFKYQDRFAKSLNVTIGTTEILADILELKLTLLPGKERDKESSKEFWENYLDKSLQELFDILPITGKNFSYKRDYAIGESIFNFASKENEITNLDFEDLKEILRDNNGIKLYRNNYRIGFLGNKESDWIYLQQYRTSGQQYYRINSANTIGYISVNDIAQKYITEISSRLDINSNRTAEVFKMFITVVFNKYFYELNRRADKLVKDILKEERLIDEPIKDRVAKKEKLLKELISQNKKVSKEINKAIATLSKDNITDSDLYVVRTTLETANEQISKTGEVFEDSKNIVESVKVELEEVEVESYNNYKLMANGLITETITHELHSICNSSSETNLQKDFDSIKEFLISTNIQLYNTSFISLQDNYKVLLKKVEDIGSLYSFVEKTFIKKGDFLYLFSEQILDTVSSVESKLKKDIKKNRISITTDNLGFEWLAPKGVLLHVFYNLLTNSIYWIDERRKRSKYDKKYSSTEPDKIMIRGNAANDTIFISDTGTGVLENMQYTLFQAFESGKGRDGRGMGLYIVKRLLNSFHADIVLLNEINQYGNRYIFAIQKNNEGVPNGVNGYTECN